MLNYVAPEELLAPLVPAGVDLDHWRGTLYVSVVGFLFRDTRVLGVPIPAHRTFPEVNLRFYVRRDVAGETRRGVVFVCELVPRRAIALVARLLYNEPYRALPMRHALVAQQHGAFAREYAWRPSREWTRLSARTFGPSRVLEANSEEEFITEHYWGYNKQPDGSALEYRVEHPRWRVYEVSEAHFDCDVVGLYGTQFHDSVNCKPSSAFLAEGSQVTVFTGERVTR